MPQPNDSRGLDELLAAYAAGALSPPLYALVASHLVLSPRNIGFVAALEEGLSAAMEMAPGKRLPDRDQRLAAIFAAEAPAEPALRQSPLPAPLQSLIGVNFDEIRWRTRLPGISEYHIAAHEAGEATLYRIKSGRKMPVHTHRGTEATLVLRGSFRDAFGVYGIGDIALADSEIDHQPIVDSSEDCLCFAVTDAPLRLTGPVGRYVDRLFGSSH